MGTVPADPVPNNILAMALPLVVLSVAAAGAVVMRLPADGVGQRQPAEKRRELAVGLRPEDHMPMSS